MRNTILSDTILQIIDTKKEDKELLVDETFI